MIVTFEYLSLSLSLSLHNQTKEERVIFSPRGKRHHHHRLSLKFFFSSLSELNYVNNLKMKVGVNMHRCQ